MSNMDAKYAPLFTPWKIRNVEIKNRIVLCPMGGTSLFGWMEYTGNHFRLINSGAIETKAGVPFPNRLQKIYDEIDKQN